MSRVATAAGDQGRRSDQRVEGFDGFAGLATKNDNLGITPGKPHGFPALRRVGNEFRYR